MAQHGRYKIIKRVADGGMAEIFLATQLGREGFAKPVILKRIHSTIYADPQFRNMFIDEAHISMSLSHSNIAQVLDLGVSAGRYFLVLELVDGWDLGRVLHRAATAGVRLPRELALHVTAEVCRALAYAHSKADGQTPLGIVHRDVSPHNILLSEQGEVKLTDFGIAKAMNKREHTGTGVVKGKVAFMSPEQAMGKAIDQRSDLFSVGTVLYLMVTRSRPFEGPTDLETLLRVQTGDFRPPQETSPDLPPEVAAVVARAMRKEPAERYQSADEMLGDVERVLRTAFRPVGQTELKRWLAELAVRDGVAPISRIERAGRAHHLDARPRPAPASWKRRTSSCSTPTKRSSTVRRRPRWRSSKEARCPGRAPRARARRCRICRCPRTPNRCPTFRVGRSSRCRSPTRKADGRGVAAPDGAAGSRSCSSERCWWRAPGSPASTPGRTLRPGSGPA